MRVLLIMFLSILSMQADATMEIIKNIEKTPSITVVDASDSSLNSTLNRKFLKLLIGDLKVSANFKVQENYIQSGYASSDVISALVHDNIDLAVKCELKQDTSGKLNAKVKLLNAKNGSKVFEKFYTISKTNRYPFLSHNIAIDINDQFGGPSIAWMNKYIVFSKYTSSGKSSIMVSDYTLSYTKRVVKNGLNLFQNGQMLNKTLSTILPTKEVCQHFIISTCTQDRERKSLLARA